MCHCPVLNTFVSPICKNLRNKNPKTGISKQPELNWCWKEKQKIKISRYNIGYLYGIPDVDHKCIWNRLHRNPSVIFQNLKSYWAALSLLQNCEGTAIWMRAKTQYKVRSWTWWVVVHPHSLHSNPKHFFKSFCFQAKAYCYVLEQTLAKFSHISWVSL